MSAEEVVVALLAVVAGSMLKSISGFGLPLVTVPVISYFADIETAVAVTAVPNVILNGALAWRERAHIGETRDLVRFGGAGFVGAVVGTVALVSVPDSALVALLLVVVLAYATIFFTNPEFRIEPERARRLAPAVGAVAGTMQGAVGISGPIVGSWIHAYRLPRNAHILSVTALFAVAGAAQVPALAANGAMDGVWPLSIVACGPALATIPVGARLRNAVSSSTFDRIVVVTLTASTLGLAIRTFT
jgi:uncharacterized membrane protein YfcA